MGDKQYIGCNMRREHCYTEIFEQTALSREFKNFFHSNAMPDANCALFGCLTSRKSSLLLNDGDKTYKALKVTAHKEWLRVVLRTREMTPDLKKGGDVDENNLFLCCEQHLQ
jgi:hypothetical protein